jgi:hypothetical protein
MNDSVRPLNIEARESSRSGSDPLEEEPTNRGTLIQ